MLHCRHTVQLIVARGLPIAFYHSVVLGGKANGKQWRNNLYLVLIQVQYDNTI